MTSVLIVTTMRNEGPFVLDWVAHHRALGVEHLLVYSNDCEDGTDALLDALASVGALTHVRQAGGEGSVQWRALKQAWRHPLRKAADWAICMDCDEYVALRPPFATLQEMIARADEVDAITLPWRFFGHAGHLTFEETPVPARFTRAAPQDAPFPLALRFFKTLMRLRGGPFAKFGVHRPKTRARAPHVPRWRNGSGAALPEAFAADDGQILLHQRPASSDWVQLNHYSLRSLEDFMVKRARGLPNRSDKPIDALYWAERNFNTVEDGSIARHAGPTARETARLLAGRRVAGAHAACVSAHRARIAAILSDPQEAHLYTRLALLADSAVPAPETAVRLAQLAARSWN